MAAVEDRTAEQVRREIELERRSLADAVDQLRRDLSATVDVPGKLKAKLPAAILCAAAVGFVLAGGIGATVRMMFGRR